MIMVFSILPFIIFNIIPYSKTKIFLGDGGSLFLGYIISWILINRTENINGFTISLALWCVAIPLFDLLAVIFVRILNKHSLTKANKDHIHHFLENLRFPKKFILLIIISSGLIFLLIGNILESHYPTLSFPVFLTFLTFYSFLRIYHSHRLKIKKLNK